MCLGTLSNTHHGVRYRWCVRRELVRPSRLLLALTILFVSRRFQRRNWKTRFATLTAKQLLYYASEEDAERGHGAKGGILFEGASIRVFDAQDDTKRCANDGKNLSFGSAARD